MDYPPISTSCLEHSQIFMYCFHQTAGNIYIKVHKSAGLKSASFSQSLFLAGLHLLADTPWNVAALVLSFCLFSLRHSKSPNSKLLARSEKQDSPLLPVSAKQKPDALVQRGPAGLVSEKSQEVRTEGGHLGPCLKGPNTEEM